METFLIILGILAVLAGVTIYLQKTGKIKDADGDLIPDSIEEKIEEVKEVAKVVKARAKRVAEETNDVVKAVKEVAKQSKDVVIAVKGTPRKGRKPSTKKPAANK
jgi:methyl-accepting chemotaxis protein